MRSSALVCMWDLSWKLSGTYHLTGVAFCCATCQTLPYCSSQSQKHSMRILLAVPCATFVMLQQPSQKAFHRYPFLLRQVPIIAIVQQPSKAISALTIKTDSVSVFICLQCMSPLRPKCFCVGRQHLTCTRLESRFDSVPIGLRCCV